MPHYGLASLSISVASMAALPQMQKEQQRCAVTLFIVLGKPEPARTFPLLLPLPGYALGVMFDGPRDSHPWMQAKCSCTLAFLRRWRSSAQHLRLLYSAIHHI
jgi:hypothetical protein